VGLVVSRALVVSLFRGDCTSVHLGVSVVSRGRKGLGATPLFFCRDRERVSGDRQDTFVPCVELLRLFFRRTRKSSFAKHIQVGTSSKRPGTEKATALPRFSRPPLIFETRITASQFQPYLPKIHPPPKHIAACFPRSTPATGSSPAPNPRRDHIAKL